MLVVLAKTQRIKVLSHSSLLKSDLSVNRLCRGWTTSVQRKNVAWKRSDKTCLILCFAVAKSCKSVHLRNWKATEPWWPGGKVSASGREDSRFEIRFHCRSAV
ncbi:hypothetical protein AVEN_31544-1 [Araneus ventricosus]|uniref:Uncharacterized protein n=1 Tax=Araneus ventricosus TaxID=182803 RepID=A0A4Y2GNI1_ARAVE|nr:hypothetical protein AVEN_31544-1 [Araneus ventricosus]